MCALPAWDEKLTNTKFPFQIALVETSCGYSIYVAMPCIQISDLDALIIIFVPERFYQSKSFAQ
jgi:hypothetical protein